MRQRDKAIVEELHQFRCLSRDDIVDLHFSNLKSPITSANYVLKRLRRDGYIDVNTEMEPYIYFPKPSSVKKDSQKIPHFLSIVDFYKQIKQHQEPKQFIVEPKYGKEYMEPDIFMIWQGAPFFVEIQRSVYTEKVMRAKLERYEKYFYSEEWKDEAWQPTNKKFFPYIWIIADIHYKIDTELRVYQTRNVKGFLEMIKN